MFCYFGSDVSVHLWRSNITSMGQSSPAKHLYVDMHLLCQPYMLADGSIQSHIQCWAALVWFKRVSVNVPICALAGIFWKVTGINRALGTITAACPEDRREQRGRGSLLWACLPAYRQRYREETERQELSEKVRDILMKKDWGEAEIKQGGRG